MAVLIQLRRDTLENWNSVNPVIAQGEMCLESQSDGTYKMKIGDGVRNWSNLPYFKEDSIAVLTFPTLSDFPNPGSSTKMYKAEDTDKVYVWDVDGAAYKQTTAESVPTDTLETVMNRGNYAPREIEFKDVDGDSAFLGYHKDNYSLFFGSFNRESTGVVNVSIGLNSLQMTTTGGFNTGIGNYTLNQNTTGANNTAIGNQALQNLTTGQYNIAIGSLAGQKANGSDNIMIGKWAGYSIKAGKNICIGHQAGQRVTDGYHNILFGEDSGWQTTTGTHNLMIGYRAGGGNVTGSRNFIAGFAAANEVSGWDGKPIGNDNVIWGSHAMTYNTNFTNRYPILKPTGASISGMLVIDGREHWDASVYENKMNGMDSEHPLICGSFYRKYLYFGGRVIIDNFFISSDAEYTKEVVMKPDGTIGAKDRIGDAFPENPLEGDIFYKKSDKKHYGYDGTNWNPFY